MIDQEPSRFEELALHISLFLRSTRFRTWRLAMVLVGGLLITLLIANALNSGKSDNANNNTDYVADSRIDSFDRVYQQGNAEEIIGFLELISVSEQDELPIQLDCVARKLKLSKRLTEIGTTDEHVKRGLESILDAHVNRVNLLQINDLETESAIKVVEDLATSLLEHKDPDIQRRSRAAMLIVELEKFRVSGQAADRIRRGISEAVQWDPESAEMAGQIIRTLAMFGNLSVDISPFLELVREEYENSRNSTIRQLLVDLKSAFFRRDYRITPLTETEKNYVQQTQSEHLAIWQTVMSAMESGDTYLSESMLNRLVHSMSILVQLADHESLQAVFEKTRPLLKQQNSKALIWNQFNILDVHVQQLGKELPVSSLQGTDDKELSLAAPANAIKLLVFVDAESHQNSIRILKELSTCFDRLIDDQLLSLVVVILGGEDLAEQSDKLRQSLSDSNFSDIVELDVSQNAAWFDCFPVPWSPYWILVDEKRRLIEFNSMLPIIRSRIHRYLKN